MDLYRRSPSTKLSSCSLDEVDGTGSRGPESTSGKAHSSSALSIWMMLLLRPAPAGEVAGARPLPLPSECSVSLRSSAGTSWTGNSQCGNGALHMIKTARYFFRSHD